MKLHGDFFANCFVVTFFTALVMAGVLHLVELVVTIPNPIGIKLDTVPVIDLLLTWGIGLMVGILAAVRARRAQIRERRLRAGLCSGCGYNLRASTNRCPECGMRTETLHWTLLNDE